MSRRRPHKKSRLGCQECKRRHVKCDEARPACRNCLTLDRTCIYPPSPAHAQRPPLAVSKLHPLSSSAGDVVSTPAATTPSTATTSAVAHISTPSTFVLSAETPSLAVTSPAQHDALYPPVNMRHMELLSNFIMVTGPSLAHGHQLDPTFFHVLMPIASSAPYLMHQILALSAMHLSHTRPELAQFYHEEAMALQTQALAFLNDSPIEINSANCAPMLVFTSFLGMHALAEAVASSKNHADTFLDKYLSYSNLHRGVRAITAQSWDLLMQSNISPILTQAEQLIRTTSLNMQEQAKTVADRLYRLLDDACVSTSSEEACRDAVSHLQLVYQTEASFDDSVPTEKQPAGLIWAWPILLSGDFTDLLLRRTPEALVILCYYAVLLHRHRDLWLVGPAGRMLIEAITGSLGTYWKEWLDWPNAITS
ncbi:uncharacterized protein CC84DRAFT_1210777 [Paraphaeosphaeria sporulosa]|uniref:Zn(2)-C6 fungal-type domain-containing protein n=1 Tax=Paraphaeosphaeria sporulosa TaxID=1460663 RepID=A0A177BT18_9PLEO|nr:uncharacterized protein CC84DRAFT_1210777 [Paraphaeosphaeria sporulosa]OAF98542.1 hypothetical protein CC84DRAFT_1210777 [Paraphaeosphaeria sporulosa]